VDVPSHTGDSILSTIVGWRLLVKFDLEGAEVAALRRMARSLARLRPVLVVEVHPRELETLGQNTQQVTDLLRSLGLRLFRLDDAQETELLADDSFGSATSWLIARP